MPKKKIGSGEQPPREGCSKEVNKIKVTASPEDPVVSIQVGHKNPHEGCSKEVNEVKVTASPECPVVSIQVGDKNQRSLWLIDSGAAESVIDVESWKEGFPGVVLDPLPPGIKFRTADGSPLNVMGFFVTGFWFGGEQTQARLYVCQGVTRTRLIGANVLAKFSKWGVDNRRKHFFLGDVHMPLAASPVEPPRVCTVQMDHSVKIPPRSSCIVSAALPGRYKPSEFVFRPDQRMFQRHKVLVPTCLVTNDFFEGTVHVKVTNPLDSEVTVHKGTKVGQVSSNVDDYELISAEQEAQTVDINSVQATSVLEMENLVKGHGDLWQLYTRSCKLLNEEERGKLLELLCKYRHAFSVDDNDIGTTNVIKHKIIPKSSKVVYRRQYRHSEAQHKQIEEEVEKLLDSGVIKESMSPFNSPVLMVPKSEKGKWRFCLDCRYINDLTEDQYFPIPLIDEVMDSLAGSSIFSNMDMTTGYHQVDLDKETSDMCAFSTRKGHYQYTKLPMGLRGSGMTFQKMVTLLLSGMLLTEVLAYLDDCILFSKSISQHMVTLEAVLRRFSEAHLKLKPRKCSLFQEKIVYLGYLVDKSGIRPNPEAIKMIKDLAAPSTVQEVQRFLGKVNYYRKFIPRLAEIAHPLYELTETKGKAPFVWGVVHQSAFDQIKEILCSGQVMGHPDMRKDFVLDVDASDYALGAELSQEDAEGRLRPVFYASRHLEKSERNYSATARETLAAVFGCEYFRQYLQGRKFILRTDHNPLVWLRSMREPKRPYSGWIMRLEQFQYNIQYRPGKDHTNADFNSRIWPVEEYTKSEATQTECTNTVCCMGRSDKPCEVGAECEGNTVPKEVRPPVFKVMTTKAEVYSTPTGEKEQMSEPSIKCEQGSDFNADIINPECDGNSGPLGATSTGGSTQKIINEVGPLIVDGGGPVLEADEPSKDLLSSQQIGDPDIGPVIQRLNGTLEPAQLTKGGEHLWKIRRKLELKDGMLIRHHKLKAGLAPIEQVVLPTCLREMVMESLHDDILAGHFGVKRTKVRVQLRYYWPGYLVDVEEWCNSCIVCQERRGPQSRNVAPLMSIDTGQGPFEQLALDLVKLPVTSRGNQYALVIEDYFTKWVEAFPLQGTAAPSVAQCLLNGWISRFGCPFTILSDQGREFESNLFKALNTMLQSKKLRTTTYHPRTDGMVERSNRTLIDVLSKYGKEEPDWDLKLPLVLFAIRTSEHSTTGFSPFALTYGREARVPWDIVYGPAPKSPMPPEEWVADRKKHMAKVFRMVKEQTARKQMHQKQYFDKNLKGKFQTFEVGEKVMYFDPASRSKVGKIHRPWSGPTRVVGKLSDVLYKIEVCTRGKMREAVVNTERLKKYVERGSDDVLNNFSLDRSIPEEEVDIGP